MGKKSKFLVNVLKYIILISVSITSMDVYEFQDIFKIPKIFHLKTTFLFEKYWGFWTRSDEWELIYVYLNKEKRVYNKLSEM